jgi:predicted CXXCH cytochrome family protein
MTMAPSQTVTPTNTPTMTPSQTPTLTPTASPTETTTPTVTPTPTPTVQPVRTVTFVRDATGDDMGQRRVGPSSLVTFRISAAADALMANAVLADDFPASWQVIDAGSGKVSVVDTTTSRIAWSLGDVPAGTPAVGTYSVRAPLPTTPPEAFAFRSGVSFLGGGMVGEPWTAIVGSRVIADHYRFGMDRPPDTMQWFGPTDTPLTNMPRFEAFRIRFQVSNRDTISVKWQPRIEWASAPHGVYQPIPVDYVGTSPFYVRATSTIANGQDIDRQYLALGSGQGTPVTGKSFDATNPAPDQSLGPDAYTEVEFNVRATADAAWSGTFYFRLTDAGGLLDGVGAAPLTMSGKPSLLLTQPQYAGVSASAPPVSTASFLSDDDAIFRNPHANYVATTDKCAACHRAHSGKNRKILRDAEPQASLCFTCHNGTGANSNVELQFTDSAVPANDPATGSFYSHPATTFAAGYVSSLIDDFAGVLNRRALCTDCHNPHRADIRVAPAKTDSGWVASGAIFGASGVRVTNGGAGQSPAYAWLTPISYEYELCLKCHSGYTQLLDYSRPSDQKLDKGREQNPANASYHPIQAPGRGVSSVLNAQLASTSPYKLWNFTAGDTVRCVNCHGNYRAATPGSAPAPGARLAPHTSVFAGLLMSNYESRQLPLAGPTNNYSAANFALCYQCHGEAPFRDATGDARDDTDFRFHGYHLNHLYGNPALGGGGRDINVAGAGQGNAICAECHFRVHGTTAAINTGERNNPRLVSFAPNVMGPSGGGPPLWDPVNQSCSVTCHGKEHSSSRY